MVRWDRLRIRTGERTEVYKDLCKRQVLEQVPLPDEPETMWRLTSRYVAHLEKILPEIEAAIVEYHRENGRQVRSIEDAVQRGLTSRSAILNSAVHNSLLLPNLSLHKMRIRELVVMSHLLAVYEKLRTAKQVEGFPAPAPQELLVGQ